MYIKDGIAYAGEAVPELEVASARYVGNLQMVVTFVGGEIDIAPEAVYQRSFEYQRIA